MTTVEARLEKICIAPGVDHVARGIDLDDRRRHVPGVQLSFDDVLPVQDEHGVLGIHAGSAQPSQHPSVRQGLRPIHIGLVLRRAALRPR